MARPVFHITCLATALGLFAATAGAQDQDPVKIGFVAALSGASAQSGEAAIAEVAQLERDFTVENVYRRAARMVEKCILQGTTYMRTHIEIDPVIGLRSSEAVRRIAESCRWAIDIEICIFPQEELLNNPGSKSCWSRRCDPAPD